MRAKCKKVQMSLTAARYIPALTGVLRKGGLSPRPMGIWTGHQNIYGGDAEQTRVGDAVAILFGCGTPIIIRPLQTYFQVIGEAYVQGLMDGEVMEMLDKGKLESRSFTFC